VVREAGNTRLGAVYLLVAAPILDLYAGRAAVIENRSMLVPRLKAAADVLPELRARVAKLRTTARIRPVRASRCCHFFTSVNCFT